MSMTLISTVTAASTQASLDFNSIPGTFTDLLLVVSVRSTFSGLQDDIGLKINGSTANGSQRYLQGTGAAASSNNNTYIVNTLEPAATSTASTFGNTSIYIPNYAGATNKSISTDNIMETNGSTSYQRIIAGLWSQTAAITSLSIYSLNGASLVQYSTASLYGITKGSGGASVA